MKCLDLCHNFLSHHKFGIIHIFCEGHKILRNLHGRFDWHYIEQIYGGDFANFGGLLRIYELYNNILLRLFCTNHMNKNIHTLKLSLLYAFKIARENNVGRTFHKTPLLYLRLITLSKSARMGHYAESMHLHIVKEKILKINIPGHVVKPNWL